jgi:hypothetical protein
MDYIILNDDLETFKLLTIPNLQEFYTKYLYELHQSNTCLNYLLDQGLSDPHIIHDAVCYGNYTILPRFNIHTIDNNGRTALFEVDSAYNDTLTKQILVETLLKMGLSPNIRDHEGNTALHVMFTDNYGLSDYEEIIKLCLQYGFDPNIINNAGHTVYDIIDDDDDKHWYLDIINL